MAKWARWQEGKMAIAFLPFSHLDHLPLSLYAQEVNENAIPNEAAILDNIDSFYRFVDSEF
jgi:hypothetical protein